jgi:hypothetical protein
MMPAATSIPAFCRFVARQSQTCRETDNGRPFESFAAPRDGLSSSLWQVLCPSCADVRNRLMVMPTTRPHETEAGDPVRRFRGIRSQDCRCVNRQAAPAASVRAARGRS